jgi:hypothetical protein
MKVWPDDRFQMPDKTIALLIRFSDQNNGKFSQRAKEKEFAARLSRSRRAFCFSVGSQFDPLLVSRKVPYRLKQKPPFRSGFTRSTSCVFSLDPV